jgi:hypothetical protein
MKLGAYIDALIELREEHGRDIEVCVYPYDGQMTPSPCGAPYLGYTAAQVEEIRRARPEWAAWSPPYPYPVIVTDEAER